MQLMEELGRYQGSADCANLQLCLYKLKILFVYHAIDLNVLFKVLTDPFNLSLLF